MQLLIFKTSGAFLMLSSQIDPRRRRSKRSPIQSRNRRVRILGWVDHDLFDHDLSSRIVVG